MGVRIYVAVAFFIPSILAFATGHPREGWLLLGPAAISLAIVSIHILNALHDKQSENKRVKELDERLTLRRLEREKERQQRLQNNLSDQP